MRQKSTLQKGNSNFCVIVGSKFRGNFLIMGLRSSAYAHIVRASSRHRCYSYRGHQLPWLLEIATATGDAVYQIECCIRDYHVYHRIWHPIICELLGTTSERENERDRYAVAVLEEETCCVVGHLPRLIGRECYFFLRTGETITAEVTGRRRCSDLPDGGLNILCILPSFAHAFATIL